MSKSWLPAIAQHQMRKAQGLYDVPCGTCTLCCHNDSIRILPHEDASRWQTEPHDRMPGARMLAHKPNRDCVYLGDKGCTIQDDKPQMCMEMDCRRVAAGLTWTQARKMDAAGGFNIAVWRRGRELTLTAGPPKEV